VPPDPEDIRFMRQALALARRGLGRVAPNPAVGCVIVRHGRVVGRGWTRRGGRPHAETEALAAAPPASLAGATAYVTLEPCSHHGQTPPCADALVAAGIARVVAAIEDPDPRVAGRGFARLAEAGVELVTDVLGDEAYQLNLGFMLCHREGRPMVAAKSAHSLDGRIATAAGESKWITGADTRAIGHLARARYDAVAVGRRTAEADDPRLDCRLQGLAAASPIRVVFDSTASLSRRLHLVAAARERPTILVCTPAAPEDRVAALAAQGVSVLHTAPDGQGRVDVAEALQLLRAHGVTRLLVEGGGTLIAALLASDLVDELISHRAGIIIGEDGRAAVGPLGLGRLADAPRFVAGPGQRIGDDVVEYWRRRR
jgi:diaminohydroxyphosphoribosylaminopyrimidine deaminase / 5-amino-6-(5-phosphoribosylamino)uracil reductase